MRLNKKIRSPEESKHVVERIVGENFENKLASYLNKFNKTDAEGNFDINIEKNKKGLFNGKFQINIDGRLFRYAREDYKKLDDLINHLFDHFKEELANT